MKIQHFMTLDRGTGPVTLVHYEDNDGDVMLRITHSAVYDRVVEIETAAAKAHIAAATSWRMNQRIDAKDEELVSESVAGWITKRGHRVRSIRWKDGIEGVVMNTPEEEQAFEAQAARLAPVQQAEPEKPRRRTIMG